jgi:murein DD-endopeptidase MepM/ murein hydrolase activator NlpD
MRTSRPSRSSSSPRTGRIGPAAIAVIGLVAIAIGAALKTGFIQVGRRSGIADSTINVKTGAGEVAVPSSTSESMHTPPTREASPPTPPALAADTLAAPTATEDSNAVRPTSAELTELASALIVPVAGVLPKDLLDTFDEPRGTRRHNALDIPAPRGTPVLSATDGRLQHMFASDAGGLMVYASDPTDRFVLMYAHLDRYADGLTDGMALRRGDTIGYVGTTGNAPPTVPHLHFGIARTSNVVRWWTGMPVDPRPLLRR